MARKSAPSSAAPMTPDRAIRALREFGLAYPGAHLKSPWPGHADLAVKDKTFAYLPTEGEPFSISCKLPSSSQIALLLPYAAPTAYGLGKSGWVTATPPPGTPIDVAMFEQWIDESYRAQAPKSLVKQLATTPASGSPPASAAAKKPATKKPATKKSATKKPATKKPATKKPATKTSTRPRGAKKAASRGKRR
jgi:predicted DNA-binding protein (MmcQ/YjbR family)